MTPRILLTLTRWVRRPPSRRRALMMLGIIGACVLIWGLEAAGLLPSWAQLEPMRRWRP